MIYGLGGAHNDLMMMLAMMAAVSADAVAARDARRAKRAAAAVIVAGALVKATVAVLLPFMILARRRLAPLAGALAAAAARGARSRYVAFGVHGVDVVAALNRDAAFVSTDSFANRDRAPVRQAGRVPGRPRPAEGARSC